jgi:excisionase family DNA binding protein
MIEPVTVHKRRLDGYITISEAAEILGVTAQTLRNWDNLGKIKIVKHPITKYRLFRKRDLERLLKKMEADRLQYGEFKMEQWGGLDYNDGLDK